MSKELLVFIKNPEAGKVKTRLAGDIGNEKALEVYLALLQHTLEVCKAVNVTVSIYFSESIDKKISKNHREFNYYIQQGSHLGARMELAFREAFERGSKEVIIIGSDLYDLAPEIIKDAFLRLEKKDSVIGPAKDGGYYLLGLKSIPKGIFDEKPWGGPSILRSTLDNLKGYNVDLLRELNDIDVLDDLRQHPELMQLSKIGNYGTTT